MGDQMSPQEYLFCDGCTRDISFGEPAWLVGTGRVDDQLGTPVVELLCNHCHHAAAPDS